jgi:hypothetical protein
LWKYRESQIFPQQCFLVCPGLLSLLPYTMKSSRMCNTPSIPSIVSSISL